jgi:hypothetical protein
LPGYWMLFVLQNGVPSHAETVQILAKWAITVSSEIKAWDGYSGIGTLCRTIAHWRLAATIIKSFSFWNIVWMIAEYIGGSEVWGESDDWSRHWLDVFAHHESLTRQ